ncbi:MAG TPA: glycine cleavage system aminomethyltransferase GcvT [Anaerolineaceae bacterium]|nr:glycine cleavage system aminomethyltransferase GcvT [Anaerolineaceae bacterium]
MIGRFTMTDFLMRGSLADLDPEVLKLTEYEKERQFRKLILIPSESTAPAAVRESLGSVFQNIYAEGYPDEEMRWMTESQILDYPARLTFYRRNADPRYYKGVEYADMIESLARRRCAETFATDQISADQIYVNVQALSGAPANNAVYNALIEVGDSILGMNLLHGGHLTHGSSVNRSGKLFKVSHYNVDPVTEMIDYDKVQQLALECKPKILICGYSSYPFVPDWKRFREIADSVGAYLLADVSHIAGMIAAKTISSPVGYAHIITFTTHKTICGPRGACILTTDAALSRKIDKGVFPGEQGGPHVHVFAALATTFKIAQSKTFADLQSQIIKNSSALTKQLQVRGMRIPFGGTNTHLANLDCKLIKGPDGTTLSGDMAARILDVAGIVLNRNTIPGDKTANNSSGIRFGTPWMTQRGLKEDDMVEVANIMVDLLQGCTPYSVETRKGLVSRAKVDFKVLEDAKKRVRTLCEKAGADLDFKKNGYPQFYYLDDQSGSKNELSTLKLSGPSLRQYVTYCFSSEVELLQAGQSQKTSLATPLGLIEGAIENVDDTSYRFSFPREKFGLAATFLRGLAEGYITFDKDIPRRIPGSVVVIEDLDSAPVKTTDALTQNHKPYFIGQNVTTGTPLPAFEWKDKESTELFRTTLYETHKKLGAKIIPFAGWEMPVWYTSVVEEHLACRQVAGLFDVSHMGVFQAEGIHAALFLETVCGNDINSLAVGESCYTHFLDPEANVIDDTLVYRRDTLKYLVVVNASNDAKDWAWLNAVREGKVMIDSLRPWIKTFGAGVTLRNLRDPKAGADMRVDIALQGPKSRDILLSLGCDASTQKKVKALKRTELCDAVIGGFDLVVSRTGYTGEKMAFELFVHPEKAAALWDAICKAGEPLGMKACGLGARDSLRTEAGLPLYGHEMGGKDNFSVSEAGFGSYVKIYKPWFIGRSAYIEKEKNRSSVVVRFRFSEKGVRMAHNGDPVMDAKGKVIGKVTSCAIDKEGFLTGQAFVETRCALVNTPISIFQGAENLSPVAPASLETGDRISLPTPAVVVSRFPIS